MAGSRFGVLYVEMFLLLSSLSTFVAEKYGTLLKIIYILWKSFYKDNAFIFLYRLAIINLIT